jgi:hypothetical protein
MTVSKSIAPFESLLGVIDAIPLDMDDRRPLRDYMPGAWPTIGELRALVESLRAASFAPSVDPSEIKDVALNAGSVYTLKPGEKAALKFPDPKAGMIIEHNGHKCNYEPIDEYIIEGRRFDWKNDEQRDRAIATDEVWVVEWYPNTLTLAAPKCVAAPTLEEALEYANEL